MCVLFEFRQGFFTLGTRLRIDLCKKSDRTRCLAVSILEYNINSKYEVGRASESVLVF